MSERHEPVAAVHRSLAEGAAERVERVPGLRADGALWFAMLAPPVAFLGSLMTLYGFVPKVCANGLWLLLQLLPAPLLAISLAGGLVAWRQWRALGPSWPGGDAHPATRARFMAVIALLGCALFSTIIAWQWIATLMLEPCQ